MEHTEFPSAETLAAFIDGQLDEETMQRVTEHVADCDECYATVTAARAWQQSEAQQSNVVPLRRSHANRWSAAFAAAAAVAVVVWFSPPVQDRLAMHELVVAANHRQQRGHSELPLSADFDYRTAAAAYRGGGDADEKQSNAKNRVGWEIAAATARIAERNDEHALGIAYLVSGDASNAVTHLSNAAGPVERCSDAKLLSDLGAAEYAANDLGKARQAYTRAATLAPDYAPARFGLAQTLQDLGRKDEAKTEWNAYLKLDSSSPWAFEAREKLRELE